jgi:thioredoxin-related protein
MERMRRPGRLYLSRRSLLGSAALLAATPFRAQASPHIGADGLYEEPWFPKPTFDLRKDFASAAAANKRFVTIWELRGCSWCRLLHTVNFARDDIAAFAKEHFSFIQISLRGARPCVDFDGEALSEELLGLKYEVASTPTIQFFAPADGEAPRELGRISYREPNAFLRILHLIREGRHGEIQFDEWQRSTRGAQ